MQPTKLFRKDICRQIYPEINENYNTSTVYMKGCCGMYRNAYFISMEKIDKLIYISLTIYIPQIAETFIFFVIPSCERN